MSAKKKADHSDLRNVEVKTLRGHRNDHGDKPDKKKGDTYFHPRPEAEIKAGLVELAESGAKPAAR